MRQPFLSAVIITFNEERNIGRCLSSLADVVDELVVVDSGSEDATVALAQSAGARVLHHPFEGHIQQKNWAAAQARGEWVLSLDADEALSPELRDSLLQWRESEKQAQGYAFNRLTSYCGQWVRHGGWYPDRKLRLWRAGLARWTGQNPHDRLEMNPGATPGWLSGDLLHYSYYTVADHRRQIRYFTDIAATTYAGPMWLTWLPVRGVKSGFQWMKNAVFRGGWRDGSAGWSIAKWSAWATWEKYRKAGDWRMKRAALERAGRDAVKRVLVCRTDALGDVAVTLPMVGWLSERFEVDVLVRAYAEPVARASRRVSHVLVWDGSDALDFSAYDAAILAFPDVEVAKALNRAGVPLRVGTQRRWPFVRYVNLRNATSRKVSGRHEAWHGMDLAATLHPVPGWLEPGLVPSEDATQWAKWGELKAASWAETANDIPAATTWMQPGMRHVILHAGSNQSANNWPLERYEHLMERALESGCRVIWTGTAGEAAAWPQLKAWGQRTHVVDATGALTLGQLMALIQACDGLVASSTGPLHLAAGLGTPCVGLYGHRPPVWPERWAPIGQHAAWIAAQGSTKTETLEIEVEAVWTLLTDLWKTPAE